MIPGPSKSVYGDAVAPWRGEKASRYKQKFLEYAHGVDFPVHTPYVELTAAQRAHAVARQQMVERHRRLLCRARGQELQDPKPGDAQSLPGRTACDTCGGSRLKPEAAYVRVDGHALPIAVRPSMRCWTFCKD